MEGGLDTEICRRDPKDARSQTLLTASHGLGGASLFQRQ